MSVSALLKILNPDMATGFPKGGRISLHSLPNTRDLGAIVTADDRHILPRRLLRSGELYHISESDKNRLERRIQSEDGDRPAFGRREKM